MPVLTGSCSAEIDFAIELCWALVADIGSAPQWQRTLERVEILERDELGRAVVCDTVSNAKLFKVRSRVAVTYEPPTRMRWTQLESEDLDTMEGSWELAEIAPARTRATYALSVDPGPIGFLARPLERAVRPLVMGRQAGELARALATRA